MTAVAVPRGQPAERQSWFARNHVGLHTALAVIMIVWAIPTIGLVINSFRPGDVASDSGWWSALFPPYSFTFENYSHVLGTTSIGTNFLNSLFISIPATVIPLFVFAVYLLRNYMGSLPREVFESAAIDGASPVTAFFRLAIPMSVPVIAALAIFQFLFVWNDLLVALIYLSTVNPDNNPLTVSIAGLVTSIGGGSQYLGAAAFISMALPLIVFFSLQRYFVRGIVGGSVKG